MAKFKNPFQGIQVVYRRSNPMLKVVVIACIVLSMAAAITLMFTIRDIEARTRDMRAEAARLEQENAELTEKIGELGSIQSVMDIAKEELGLVDPDTIIIDPQEGSRDTQ